MMAIRKPYFSPPPRWGRVGVIMTGNSKYFLFHLPSPRRSPARGEGACGRSKISGRRAWSILLLSLLGASFSFLPPAVQAQEKDIVLPESGIRYPGGFDPNTVGEVQGKTYGYSQPTGRPIQFRVESGRETYIVIASPSWYWNDLGAKILDGTEVKVRGSKSLGKDGNLYLIAQEMRVLSTGKTYSFRYDDGYPLWKGPRTGAQGSGGGFSSPQKGIGGGPGGMGKGRR
jgi:hypothetical protein